MMASRAAVRYTRKHSLVSPLLYRGTPAWIAFRRIFGACEADLSRHWFEHWAVGS